MDISCKARACSPGFAPAPYNTAAGRVPSLHTALDQSSTLPLEVLKPGFPSLRSSPRS